MAYLVGMKLTTTKQRALLALSVVTFLVMVAAVLLNDLGWIYLALLVVIFLPQVALILLSSEKSKESGVEGVDESTLTSDLDEGKQENSSSEGTSFTTGVVSEGKIPLGSMGSRDYGRKVLLVEDNKDYQQVTVLLLKSMGLDVDVAMNGKLAFDACQNKGFDLILMDMNMPTMGGLRATQLIRHAKGPNAATPIIALTSHSDSYNKEKCYEAGMNSFLVKSCSIEEMIEEFDLVFEQTTMMEIDKDHHP
jgi:CheY-like chemotaxis protein